VVKPLRHRVRAASGIPDWTYHRVRDTAASLLKTMGVDGNAARRYTDHAQTDDPHERNYTDEDALNEAAEDVAEVWGRYVLLVARGRIWAKVSVHLEGLDIAEGDQRRRTMRDRRRRFHALIRVGGQEWTGWVIKVVRDERNRLRKATPPSSPAVQGAPQRPRLTVVAGGRA
jgi:hypothetical protein